MNLIACDKPCLHQKDGYCSLEKVTFVTSSKEKGCLHYIDSSERQPELLKKTPDTTGTVL